jgi:squalene-hopene/tetraprenyl-beta-curcumene cyclase
MLDGVNDMAFAKGSKQGGFVYATVENADSVDSPPANWGDSEAGKFEETMDDGTKVSKWRCYGSMTYAGFKSYVYAALPRNDLRVQAALGWIRKNYTLEENPGLGGNGMYYYYVAFARALNAWGEPTLDIPTTSKDADGKEVTKIEKHDWGNDLVDRLAKLQNEDGSFKSLDKRWMEDNPELITAYALIALRQVGR